MASVASITKEIAEVEEALALDIPKDEKDMLTEELAALKKDLEVAKKKPAAKKPAAKRKAEKEARDVEAWRKKLSEDECRDILKKRQQKRTRRKTQAKKAAKVSPRVQAEKNIVGAIESMAHKTSESKEFKKKAKPMIAEANKKIKKIIDTLNSDLKELDIKTMS